MVTERSAGVTAMPFWRVATRELVRLPFDGIAIIPLVVVILLVVRVVEPTIPLEYRYLVAWLVSFAFAIAYVARLRRSLHRALDPPQLGRTLLRLVNRRLLRTLFDPTVSILPWAFLGTFVYLWGTARATMHAGVAVLLTLIGCASGIALARAISRINVGNATSVVVGRTVLQVLSVMGLLFLLTAASQGVAVLLSAAAISAVAWAARSYVRISLERVRQENVVNRDFGVTLEARTAVLRTINALIEIGAPPRFAFWLLKGTEGIGLANREPVKQLAKAECALLSLRHRHKEVSQFAHKYVQRHCNPASDDYSESIVNAWALALLWSGKFQPAEDLILKAIRQTPSTKEPNPYFLYTHARIIWHRGDRDAGFERLQEALDVYFRRNGRHCLPGVGQKVAFILERGLEKCHQGDIRTFEDSLDEATRALAVVHPYAKYAETASLIHWSGNISALRAVMSSAPIDERLGLFQDATEKFLMCLWQGSHLSSRLRIGLLHAIGTSDYTQAHAYLRWLRDTLRAHRYSEELPFVKRVQALLVEVQSLPSHIVLTDRVLLCQGSSTTAPDLTSATATTREEGDRAYELRARIFSRLRVGPNHNFLPLLSPR